MKMRDAEKAETENVVYAVTAAIYYVVMLAALMVGLYGLFSLFWLATNSIARNAQISGSPF
jgi:hypothetical protein